MSRGIQRYQNFENTGVPTWLKKLLNRTSSSKFHADTVTTMRVLSLYLRDHYFNVEKTVGDSRT